MTETTMQYLVIQGRAPQDGTDARRALILCPSWMSATLVCAGITGRIIEMTDGSIVEGRVLPYTGREEDLLAEIRAEFGEEGLTATMVITDPEAIKTVREAGMPPERSVAYWPQAPCALLSDCEIDAVFEKMPNGPTGFLKDWGYRQFARAIQDRLALNKPELPDTQLQDCDDAYRKGAQSMRDTINQTMHGLGMPEGAKPGQWVKEQLRNLDAWRDAAGAAELCVEYDETGMVRKIFGPAESGGVNTSEIAPALNALLLEFGGTPGGDYLEFLREQLSRNASSEIANLNTLCAAFGCLAGQDRVEWLRSQLAAAANADAVIATLRDDFNAAMQDVDNRDGTIEQLRKTLLKIKKQVKAAL